MPRTTKTRHVVVITREGQDRPPLAVGPYTSYEAAVVRHRKIVEYLEREHDVVDGTDVQVDLVAIESGATPLREIAEATL